MKYHQKVLKKIVKDRISGLIPELQKKCEEVETSEKTNLQQVVDDLQKDLYHNKTLDELTEIV